MDGLISNLVKFVGQVSKGKTMTGSFGKVLSGLFNVFKSLATGVAGLALAIGGGLLSVFTGAIGIVKDLTIGALGMELSFKGLMEEAEKARRYWSEMADSMNFYSSSTGSTTKAVGMLTTATGQSKASLETLKGAFGSLVDAGVDSDKFIEDMLPTLGDFEVKTGVAASQWAMFSGKLQQSLSDKKGITNDIKSLQKALIGTGLKGAQLEATLQGLTEVTEKLAFATTGASLDIKQLSNSYSSTVATFKAFGISAQTTTNFLNGMIDPENVEKNMLLMNKMGISYQEYNDMLNSGKGQDKFFDKILSNVGKVAQEANMIQDASSRFKYLKDTLGLPPEIANKLMKVTPSKMQSELRKIKKEMADAEKRDKWKKDLKAREEKYEEAMTFLRMQMVAPLVEIVTRNRTAVMNFMRALKPVFQFISDKIAQFIKPLTEWMVGFGAQVEKVTKGGGDVWGTIKSGFGTFFSMIGDTLSKLWNDPDIQAFFGSMANTLMGGIIKGLSAIWDSAMNKFGEYITELGWSILKGLGVALALMMLPITGPVAAIIGTLAAIAGAFTVWTSFDKDEANSKQTAKDMIGKKELRSDVELTKKLGDNDEFNKLEETLKKGITDKGLVGTGGFGGTNTQINDILQDLKTGNADSVQKNIAELKQELLKANGPGKEKQIDEYLKSVVDMAYENNDSAKKTAEVVQGTTEGVAKEIEKNKAALEQTKTLANEKLSDAEVAAAVQKLMGDPGFMSAISSSIVSNKDKRINELTTQIDALETQSKALKDEFEKLKTESVPGILKQWEQFLFGEQPDSIRMLLKSITELSDEDLDMQRKKEKGNKPGGSVKNTDITNFNDMSKLGSSVTSAKSKLIEGATGAGVKNIQVKQTLYLKSIADSTYDSAAILKYIGRNLVFTPTGLAVNQAGVDTTNSAGYKRYNFDGSVEDTTKNVFSI